jgi:UPF0755 protein
LPSVRAARWFTGALIPLLIAAIAVVVIWRWYEHAVPMTADRVEVSIAAGSSARAVARQLRASGVQVADRSFVALARMTGATKQLRAGRYEVLRGASLHDIIDKLRRGEVLRERLTVVEGWSFREMRAAMAASPFLRADSAKLSNEDLLKAVGASEAHPEGLFAPDTYVFDPGSSDIELLRQAYRQQKQRLAAAWDARDASLPYKTPYDALIMASIVEKETGQGDERKQIAGVFVNRLRKGMLLQTDPTVIYGLGESFDGNLRKKDLTTDTPYNTYTRAGLPPTPIALPGRAAIEAALAPAATRALYFVSRGDGTSQFSDTLAEHNRAVARYQLGQKPTEQK